ncbi:hypothetical protein Gogos_000664 [Gossypium gossypioides]|uniref:Uncharacterized protein n=1 Tax=Gossypium gossypioides TaxID=34282 RepID=A0A7J9CTD0_GOSGO|nr:hypothetical protein [Gossypium gossypioides]
MEISLNTGGDRNFLEANSGESSQDDVDRNTKKVRFKEANKDVDTNMLVDPSSIPTLSWKDKLLRNRIGSFGKTTVVDFGSTNTFQGNGNYSGSETAGEEFGDLQRYFISLI